MRALLRPLAIHAAFSPIETIVAVFVLGTLAYFHVLSAIKHSAFFAPTYPSTLRPAHALSRDNKWVGVSQSKWYDTTTSLPKNTIPVELQQIIFSLDHPTHKTAEVGFDPVINN